MEVRILDASEAAQLARVADGVFDNPVNANLAKEFLLDPRHHIAVAIEDRVVIGMASAVHYIHPDKPAELCINEVSVAALFRNRGIGKLIMKTLFDLTNVSAARWLGYSQKMTMRAQSVFTKRCPERLREQ